MIGVKLGHIQIIEKIGEGGMGAVYRSHDENLRRDVAVKVLPRDALTDASARRRFRKEALALSRLNHPNIEIIYDFDTHEGMDYLVMEYIPGHTLKGLLLNGPMPEKEILRLGTQIGEGLAAAHERGIVHCDLKPGNIMVTQDGRLKILDFGLAKQVHPASREDETESAEPSRGGGTLPYMAPEQLLGEPLDARTDIYALGNILYEMAAGRLPFQGVLSTALVNEIVNSQPPRPGDIRPGLSSRLEDIVLKCLEKDPENRYQSAKELIVDLRRSSTSSPPGARGGIPAKRRGVSRRTVALMALLACLLSGLALVLGRKERDGIPSFNSIQITRSATGEEFPVFSPDGTQIAFTRPDESGSQDLYLTDIRSSTTRPLTGDAAMDTHPAWFPEGDAVAFTSDRGGENAIWRVSRMGGEATLLVPDAQQASISPDGTRIAFCRNRPGGGLRIWVASMYDSSGARQLTRDDDGIWDHRDPAWSPDGKEICYGTRHGLWTVPVSGGRARRLTTDEEYSIEPVWSRDGRFIYFASKRSGSLAIWRIPSGGGELQRVTTGTALESHPDISRDGKRLCYSTGETTYRSYLLDIKTGRETHLAELGADTMAAISPDNGRIVFTSDRGAFNYNLWILPLRDGKPSGPPYRLTNPPGIGTHAAFSADGNWIVYYRVIGETRHVWIVPARGGQPVQFTDGESRDYHPAWSPDGAHIAYCAEEQDRVRLMVAPVKDGRRAGPARPLTGPDLFAVSPAWSRDGRTLAFCGGKNNAGEVWTVPADGSSPPRRVARDLDVRFVRWDHSTGDILASAVRGSRSLELYRVSPNDGSVRPFQPPIVFGGENAEGLFHISADSRYLVSTRMSGRSGSIWALEATSGTF